MGDLITQIEMIDDGWATGLVHGKAGMFPIGYVEMVQDMSPTKPTRTNSQTQPTPQPQPEPSVAPLDKGLSGTAVYDYDAGLCCIFHLTRIRIVL